MPVSPALRLRIAQRDQNQCVYCRTTEANCGLRMHIDHIMPEAAGGSTTADNLCLACFNCNIYKGAQQQAVDPHTKETLALFNPVRQRWQDHFAWDESQTRIIGLTSCGRATVLALQMNNPTVLHARYRWVSAGWHPPEN